MARALAKTKSKKERGMALLLTLFALLLLSGIGLFMVLSSNTETRIDANYGSSLRAYYAARSGLEEVRDRIRTVSSPTNPGGLADKLPTNIAGNPNGVLYIVNPTNGETVDPTNLASPYFDDDLCHAYNSGTPKGIKCTNVPTTSGWQLQSISSQVALGTNPLGYKWIRINMKTNRTAAPYFVDQAAAAAAMLAAGQTGAPLDTPVCWDGQAEQLLPNSSSPTCEANGMQTVYMLTALAVTSQGSGVNGTRKMLQAEVVAPSIRPAGVLTTASMTATTASVPPVAIDGRVHNMDGSLFLNPDGTPAIKNGCSAISALATNTGSSQMVQMLNTIRQNIVSTANSSCKSDGSGMSGNICTAALWWVRGTDSTTRFVTSVTTTTSGGGGGHDGGSSGGPGPSSGSDGGDSHGTLSGSTTTNTPCDSTTANCYTHLNLSDPSLFATSAVSGTHVPMVTVATNQPAPFIGNPGNQADSTIYQPPASQTVPNEIAAVINLVALSRTKSNYFNPAAATLSTSANTFGTANAPAVVEVSGSSLVLQGSTANLTGFGVLVIPGSLEITSGATLHWNGIVLVQSSTGQLTVDSGALGYINGGLLLTPGAVFSVPSGGSSQPFQITYSCDAVDLAFKPLPFKVVSTAETSF